MHETLRPPIENRLGEGNQLKQQIKYYPNILFSFPNLIADLGRPMGVDV
jgi:hypothetical protein